jgi:transposase
MTAPTATPILAIDLGKYKSVACWYDPATAQARFETFTTSATALERLLGDDRPTVVIEACALTGWVHDFCHQRAVPCLVANTASEAWKFKHAKRKTDRDDALRLAQLTALKQLPAVYVPDKATREWRALIAHRQILVGQRVAAQNRVRAVLVGQGLPAPRGAKAWTEVGLQGIAAFARPLADCGPDELWRGILAQVLTLYRAVVAEIAAVETRLAAVAKTQPAVARLETIPGVGPRTAEVVAAYLPDPKRFHSGKEVGAYAGLVPRQYQSGESDRRGRITRRGPALLRKLLVECAWCMLRYNPWARAVYARLSRGRARKKQAIVALARKLLVRCWAMLRDETAWRAEPVPSAG